MPPDLNLVRQWLEKAAADLQTATLSEDARPSLAAVTCFHCQQATEKSLKAYLAFQDTDFPWTHDIGELLGLVLGENREFAVFRNKIEFLSLYAVTFRYPGTEPDPTSEQATAALL